jgi:hypothetical protein
VDSKDQGKGIKWLVDGVVSGKGTIDLDPSRYLSKVQVEIRKSLSKATKFRNVIIISASTYEYRLENRRQKARPIKSGV